jgi:DNA-binding NtrC family response regulator
MPKDKKQGNKPFYILVIEDNVHHAELLTELLDRHFAPVIIHTVDSIEDGIEFAVQANYDLILTDGVIADQPITDQIPKLCELSRDAPVIIISGQGDESLAARLIKRGASEYLPKTKETLEKLPEILKKHLTAKKVRRRKPLKVTKEALGHDNPTPSEIIIEVDRITQQALTLAGPKRRRRIRSADDVAQLDKLLGQIKRLRELASKLSK